MTSYSHGPPMDPSRLRIRSLAVPLSLALLAAACRPGGPAVDVAAEESVVRERALAWAAAEASNDVDSALALMWEDAVMQPPGAPQVEGIEAIRGLYEAVTFLSLEVGPLTVKVGSGGDLAAVWGPLVYELEGPEGRVADEGKFVAVWERRDGEWRVLENTWNSDAPPADAGS